MLGRLFAKLMGSKKAKKPAKRKRAGAKKTAPKKTSAKKSSKKPAQKKAVSSKKKKPAQNLGKKIGEVVAFFRIRVVAVVKVTGAGLKVGQRILIHGHTTKLKLTVDSMQIDHEPITEAKKGAEVGLKIPSRARRGDKVYLPPA